MAYDIRCSVPRIVTDTTRGEVWWIEESNHLVAQVRGVAPGPLPYSEASASLIDYGSNHSAQGLGTSARPVSSPSYELPVFHLENGPPLGGDC